MISLLNEILNMLNFYIQEKYNIQNHVGKYVISFK